MADLLTRVKSSLGITGNYQDDTLSEYIDEIKEYLYGAGVPPEVVNCDKSVGLISRGVSDLWNYGSGKLSEYFYQRAGQLVYSLGTGKFIVFTKGDYGESFPINIEGFHIKDSDTVTFSCNEITKDYINESDNCILVTFTSEESNSFEPGTYTWTLTVRNESSIVTLVNDGVLIVR